jgi:hypothetical protein
MFLEEYLAHKRKPNMESKNKNEELDKLIKHKNIINHIKAQTLSWFGHVQRMPDTRTVRKVFNWKPLTKRSKENPSTDGRKTLNRAFAK